MVLGFSHVQLVVRDVHTTAAWYTAVLGVEQVGKGDIASGPYLALQHPTARFVIGMHTATPEELATRGGSSVDHLSFRVADQDALEAARARLEAEGLQPEPLREEAASWNLRLRDPDGLVVELTATKR